MCSLFLKIWGNRASEGQNGQMNSNWKSCLYESKKSGPSLSPSAYWSLIRNDLSERMVFKKFFLRKERRRKWGQYAQRSSGESYNREGLKALVMVMVWFGYGLGLCWHGHWNYKCRKVPSDLQQLRFSAWQWSQWSSAYINTTAEVVGSLVYQSILFLNIILSQSCQVCTSAPK